MIDIHAHILPGIDDGARDMYDTLDMAAMAADSGVTKIIATPHCNIPGMYDNYFSDIYISLVEQVQAAVSEERIPVEILPGMEVFGTYDLPELLKAGKIMTLNQSRYLLVEFDFEEDPDYVKDLLIRIRETGARPVIAHAERYEFIQDNLQLAYELREMGFPIQVNKGSFVGRFGRRARHAAYRMMDHQLVSAVASDAHRPDMRTTFMLDAYDLLLSEYPKRVVDILFNDNPKRICENRPLIRFQLKSFTD